MVMFKFLWYRQNFVCRVGKGFIPKLISNIRGFYDLCLVTLDWEMNEDHGAHIPLSSPDLTNTIFPLHSGNCRGSSQISNTQSRYRYRVYPMDLDSRKYFT